jgi:hypothetical protein
MVSSKQFDKPLCTRNEVQHPPGREIEPPLKRFQIQPRPEALGRQPPRSAIEVILQLIIIADCVSVEAKTINICYILDGVKLFVA